MKKVLLTTAAFAALLFAGGVVMAQSVTPGSGSPKAPQTQAGDGVIFTSITSQNMDDGTVISHGPSKTPVEAKNEGGRMTMVPATGTSTSSQRSSGSAASLGDSPKE